MNKQLSKIKYKFALNFTNKCCYVGNLEDATVQQQQLFHGPLSRTTRLSQYQKKQPYSVKNETADCYEFQF